MPRMAASPPSISFTCGRRMKLAIPVKRAAFIASTGRYLGTSELRLNRLHALFVDDADHLVAQVGEPLPTHHVEGPWPRQIDVEGGADAPGPVRHDVDDVAQEDRLVDVMGDEQHPLARPLPEIGHHLLPDLARQGI